METKEQKIQRLGNSICEKLNILFGVDDFEFYTYYSNLGYFFGATFDSKKTRGENTSGFLFYHALDAFKINSYLSGRTHFKNDKYDKFRNKTMIEMLKEMQ